MQLALSGRLWETPNGYSSTLIEQIQIAADLNYQGIEVRYPLIPPASDWGLLKNALIHHKIELVFAPASGVPSTPEARDDLIRVLDFLQYCDAPFLKLIPTQESDHDAMRLAADLGAERGIRVLTQLHANTLTDTVENTVRFFETLGHPNLGLIFDAAHIPFSEEISIGAAIARLWPWIELVNLQSYKPARDDDGLKHVSINEREWSLALPGDANGTDLSTTIGILQRLGCDGWLTVMPAVDGRIPPTQVARAYIEFLNPLIS